MGHKEPMRERFKNAIADIADTLAVIEFIEFFIADTIADRLESNQKKHCRHCRHFSSYRIYRTLIADIADILPISAMC